MNPAYLLAAFGSVLFGAADFCGGLAARRAPAVSVTLSVTYLSSSQMNLACKAGR